MSGLLKTTISIYSDDHEWLKRRQLAESAARGEHVNMFDLIHNLIDSQKSQEQESHDNDASVQRG